MKALDVNKRQEPERPDSSDLLRVALAAYAAHLEKQARVRIPGATTPWGRSARIASLRRFDAR